MDNIYTQYYNADGTPAYKGFSRSGCGTVTNYKEISKEEYDRLSSMTYGERSSEIESKLSPSILYGYGFYGHDLTTRDGMYFLGITSGTSCD